MGPMEFITNKTCKMVEGPDSIHTNTLHSLRNLDIPLHTASFSVLFHHFPSFSILFLSLKLPLTHNISPPKKQQLADRQQHHEHLSERKGCRKLRGDGRSLLHFSCKSGAGACTPSWPRMCPLRTFRRRLPGWVN